jgi:small subunit ribosomal protein S16
MSHQLSGEIKLVAVKIKLKRMGSIRNPQYRVVIADARTARDGRAIEEIGLYHPKEEPSLIKINSDRVQYWLGVGAQPTEPVMVLLKITGDWQKFKGLPGAEGTLRVKEAKVDKNTKFAETVAAVANEPRTPTIRPKVEKPVEVVEEVKAEAAAIIASDDAAPEVSTETVEAVETEVVAEAAAADAVIASDEGASEVNAEAAPEVTEAPTEEA